MGITRSFSAERVLTIHADTSRGLDYGPRPEHILVHDRTEDTPWGREANVPRPLVRPLMRGDDETEGHRGADLPAREGPERGRHHRDRERRAKGSEQNDGLFRRGRGKDGPRPPDAEPKPA